jgi:CubicO group peptidase (beta-lactamase class C family)
VRGRLAEFLRAQVSAGSFPGAAWLVSSNGRVVDEGAVGDAVVVPQRVAATPETLYDLASLTKPLATALLAVRLQATGRLQLDDLVARHLPEWRTGDDRDGLTLLDLLTHRSGLPAWVPLYLYAHDVPGRVTHLAAMPRTGAPLVGVTYSCPNYLLAGFAVERAGGDRLDALFRKLVAEPLGLDEILFRPDPGLLTRIAATETGNARERELAGAAGDGYNAWRTDVIHGEVHDNNAHTLGGVAGNAGLFGTARGVARLAGLFLPGGPLLGDEERSLFGHNFTSGLEQDRAVGFQLATTPGCSAGPGIGTRGFGHTGFTGTSLWIDPEARRVVALLTNRVHPRFREFDMNAVRREFHALAAVL